MRSNNLFKAQTLIEQMSLYDFWSSQLQPLLPILADEARLTICHLKKILPDFIKVILLKLATSLSQFNGCYPQNSIVVETNPIFTTLLLHSSIAKNLKQQGINFKTLKQVPTQSSSIFEQFFDDETQKILLAGVLLERTQVSLDRLLTVWQTITLLTLASLAEIIESLQRNLAATQIEEWLTMQPTFFVVPADVGLMHAVNYQAPVSLREMQKQQQKWLKTRNLADLLPHQRVIFQQMQEYQAINFFRILPINNITTQKNPVSGIINAVSQRERGDKFTQRIRGLKDNRSAKSHDSQPSHWLDKLQKNWIATATVLSIAVFGGVSAFITGKDKPVNNQVIQQPLPQKAMYQDVAIVRVDKVSNKTDLQTTQVASKKDENAKQTKKSPLTNSIRHKDAKKSATQKQQNLDKLKESSESDGKHINPKQNQRNEQHNKPVKASKKTASNESDNTSAVDKKLSTKSVTDNNKSINQDKKVKLSKTSSDKQTAKKYPKKSTVN